MAAPSTAYLNNAVAKRMLKNPGIIEYGIPLALNSYGTWAQVKGIFKLDAFRRMKIKDGSGNITEVFIGMCKVGGININYHDVSRHSVRGMKRLVGGVEEKYVIMNDAGLNTSGFTSITSFNNPGLTPNITVFATFVSAYFFSSSQYGFRMYVFNGTSYTFHSEIIHYDIPANQSEVGVSDYLTLPDSDSGQARIMSFITNPEKTYLSSNRYIQVSWIKIETSGSWDRITGSARLNLSTAAIKPFSQDIPIFWNEDGAGRSVTLTFSFGIGDTESIIFTDSYFDRNTAEDVFVEGDDLIFQSTAQLIF